ncbi:hypothetical protein TWF594_011663 [Orbilia oligospora]|uniref:Uncharacterized protein n=1 Tax=Orbilia oligospora TaxID=2813651 RepID=A0A7C8P2A4_ORBOL|nr:hypothetical protein TWF594_011663 [Orbilia oligospora]KAF3147374.1 hypothetical protein TWF703_000215 [Orbilia oligospora]
MKTFTWQFLWFLILLVAVEAGSCPPSAAVGCEKFCSSKGCDNFNLVVKKKCICKCHCKVKKTMGKE